MDVSESSCRNYCNKLGQPRDLDAPSAAGWPGLLSAKKKELVVGYVPAVQDAGGHVDSTVAAATATGVVQSRAPQRLVDFGGPLYFYREWAKKFFSPWGG